MKKKTLSDEDIPPSKHVINQWLKLRNYCRIPMPDISLNHQLVSCLHSAYKTYSSLCRPELCTFNEVKIFK